MRRSGLVASEEAIAEGTSNVEAEKSVAEGESDNENEEDNIIMSPTNLLSHPVLEGKPNTNHVRARISNSCTQHLHNQTSSHNARIIT
jgi:hypothetical protein